jgi:hypothetical protein
MAEKPPLGALIGLAGALTIAAVTWVVLNRVADAGLDRLARIERMQAVCTERYAYARNRLDTMRVDRSALPDTIDAKSKDRMDRCGVFRAEGVLRELPNPREMNGEALPRGLR